MFVYDHHFIVFTLVNINVHVYYYVYNCRMSYTVGGGGGVNSFFAGLSSISIVFII